MQPELDHHIEHREKSSLNTYWAKNGESGKRTFKTKNQFLSRQNSQTSRVWEDTTRETLVITYLTFLFQIFS